MHNYSSCCFKKKNPDFLLRLNKWSMWQGELDSERTTYATICGRALFATRVHDAVIRGRGPTGKMTPPGNWLWHKTGYSFRWSTKSFPELPFTMRCNKIVEYIYNIIVLFGKCSTYVDLICYQKSCIYTKITVLILYASFKHCCHSLVVQHLTSPSFYLIRYLATVTSQVEMEPGKIWQTQVTR